MLTYIYHNVDEHCLTSFMLMQWSKFHISLNNGVIPENMKSIASLSTISKTLSNLMVQWTTGKWKGQQSGTPLKNTFKLVRNSRIWFNRYI